MKFKVTTEFEGRTLSGEISGKGVQIKSLLARDYDTYTPLNILEDLVEELQEVIDTIKKPHTQGFEDENVDTGGKLATFHTWEVDALSPPSFELDTEHMLKVSSVLQNIMKEIKPVFNKQYDTDTSIGTDIFDESQRNLENLSNKLIQILDAYSEFAKKGDK